MHNGNYKALYNKAKYNWHHKFLTTKFTLAHMNSVFL